jgi:hypothetical protein
MGHETRKKKQRGGEVCGKKPPVPRQNHKVREKEKKKKKKKIRVGVGVSSQHRESLGTSSAHLTARRGA